MLCLFKYIDQDRANDLCHSRLGGSNILTKELRKVANLDRADKFHSYTFKQ